MRAIGLQLVVLDEVHAGLGEHLHLRRGLLERKAYARLDDGADDGPAVDAGEPPRSVHAELRPLIRGQKSWRQGDVEQLEAGERLELERIACDGSKKVGE
jgi:hypothetical protein